MGDASAEPPAATTTAGSGVGDPGKRWGPNNPHPLSTMKTELVWEGKYDEWGNRREVDVAGCAMPMQRIETIDQPRSEAAAAGQLAMFEKKTTRVDDFRNRLIWGDNKLVMASLLAEFKGKIDLIYIDPPFDLGADFTMQVPVGDEDEEVTKEQSTLELVAFRDMWGRGRDSYLQMLHDRLVVMRQLLTETGSLYLHAGPNISHSVKLVMEEVFTASMYRSEIIWRRSNSHNKLTDQFGPIHDAIFFFSRSENFTFHPGMTPFSKGYIESRFKYKDHRGIYQPNYLTGPGVRKGESGQPWRGYDPTRVGRHWAIPSKSIGFLESAGKSVEGKSTQEILRMLEEEGLLVIPKKEGGQPMYKQYMTDGVPYQDIWAYQANTHGVLYGTDSCIDEDVKWLEQEAEKLTYNTQKPEGLLRRIVETSTNPGDLVADFFCGSGTTGAVAEKLGRRWIMADLGRFAIHTTRKRLIDVQRTLSSEGKPYRPFDVHNLGRYERQWWQQEALKGADTEHRRVVLEFFRAETLDPTKSSSPLIHGRKGRALVHVDGIDGIFTAGEAREVAKAAAAMGAKECYCLAWDFEMDIRQKMDGIYAEMDVKLYPLPIPKEIMERNRKDPPPWLEVAVLEAEPVYRTPPKGSKGEPTGVDIKLTKFLPSLAQIDNKELEEIRKRAIKSGFDFIDFWAIDFDWDATGEKPFNHHWQDYRTRKDRSLKTVSTAGHEYPKPGKYTACVKVVDVFGCDTSITVQVKV